MNRVYGEGVPTVVLSHARDELHASEHPRRVVNVSDVADYPLIST